MTIVRASDSLANAVLGNIDITPNPFRRKGGKCFLRFDGLTIENDKVHGGLKIGSQWRGKTLLWIGVSGARLENDAAVSIVGITGEQEITIS